MPPILHWGLPGDAAAWSAVAVAVAAWLLAKPLSGWLKAQERVVLLGLATLAAALSALYVHYYLGGAPRIIDATSYYLEARAISQGALSFEPPEPSGSFRGRFLTGPVQQTSLSVIFPPGYPTILALGFLVRQPMLIGPILAFALVLLTYHLAQRFTENHQVALVAACLSTLSATLRYHTADTMSHAWSAVLLTVCLSQVVSGKKGGVLLAGLAAGWLVATRPVTGALSVALALFWIGPNARMLSFLLALIPGVLLLLLHQHAATGDWWSSSQLHYYSLADGPPGCFKYGFGAPAGCLHEHGEVAQRFQEGFGIGEALETSLHRLHWHLLDIANFELLALLVPYAVFRGRSNAKLRLAGLAVLGILFVYAPFYFNGSYPGGGARFFADVLPIEHMLVAFALHDLNRVRLGLVLSLAGFAVHGNFSHQALARRDGGQPMYLEGPLHQRGIFRGLVLVNTDHGFNLGFNPEQLDASEELVVARLQRDAHDRVLWEQLGRPPAYSYRFLPWSENPGPYIQPASIEATSSLRFEAEAEWPPLLVRGGYAVPTHVGVSCASNQRALKLEPTSGAALQVELEVHTLVRGAHRLELAWLKGPIGSTSFALELRTARPEPKIGSVRFFESHCETSDLGQIDLEPGAHRFLLSVQSEAWLDFVQLTPTGSARSVPTREPEPGAPAGGRSGGEILESRSGAGRRP